MYEQLGHKEGVMGLLVNRDMGTVSVPFYLWQHGCNRRLGQPALPVGHSAGHQNTGDAWPPGRYCVFTSFCTIVFLFLLISVTRVTYMYHQIHFWGKLNQCFQYMYRDEKLAYPNRAQCIYANEGSFLTILHVLLTEKYMIVKNSRTWKSNASLKFYGFIDSQCVSFACGVVCVFVCGLVCQCYSECISGKVQKG